MQVSGIFRLEGALNTALAGKMKPDAMPVLLSDDGVSSIITVNATAGFANAAFEVGKHVLIERTKKNGLAALAINECAHLSALWPEVEALMVEGWPR
jgi:LDH2 family malate/lactate/ureidoglycolate dehydrogenase